MLPTCGKFYALMAPCFNRTVEGLSEGIEQAKLQDIEMMLAKGCVWTFIQNITSISSAEFEVFQAKYRK